MKMSKRDIGLLTGLLGIVLFFVAYQFVYRSYNDKTDALKNETAVLAQTESELVQLESNMPFYKDEITRMNSENAEIVSHFPADILPENEIMYAAELEDNNKIFFKDLTYGVSELMLQETTQQTTTTTDPDTGEEVTTSVDVAAGSNTGIQANKLTMDMGYECTYQGLKDTILYNNAQNNRMVIDGLTASYDATTGQLTGQMTLNQYYIAGTENIYQEPYVPNMKIGVKNIFGTNEGAQTAANAETAAGQ